MNLPVPILQAAASSARPLPQDAAAFDISDMPLVLLSPCLCELNYGGVQLSGRVVRDALLRGKAAVKTVCYRSGSVTGKHQGCTPSKLMAAVKAACARNHAGKVLIWHIDMLKLLPFVKRQGSKTYLFLHGVECWRTLNPVVQELLGLVDVFLTNSAFTWARFVENNPRWSGAPYQVVPLGMDAVESAPVPPGDSPAALIVGRLQRSEDYKGHKELIRAWPFVLQVQEDAELWIAGGGDLEAELKELAVRCGVSERVRFLGRISDSEKQRLIRSARCLVLPSRGEGFGLVYLEAMRSGRPCLASTHDAGREVVNPPEAGLAVDPDDPVAVSHALLRLLTPGPEWDRWSASAKRRYDSGFTAAHFEYRLLHALTA